MEIGEITWEKSITNFLTPNILAPEGAPMGQRSPFWVVGYTNPPLATCSISSNSDDICLRYLLPNFVNFVACVTQKTYNKRYVSALHAATKMQLIYCSLAALVGWTVNLEIL